MRKSKTPWAHLPNPREQAHPAQPRVNIQRFEEQFLQHWPHIYRFLLHLLGDPDQAEDAAVETFLRLYQRPPAHDDALGGWLHRVAANLGLNSLRSYRRRQRYEQLAGEDPLMEKSPDNPAEIFAAEEQRAAVRAVLAELPERQSQLLLLRHTGLSYRELAQALNISPESVGSLLHRAEDAFARKYRARWGDLNAEGEDKNEA